MYNTTICYLEKDGAYLMLHRVKKKEDINKGKWIGVGGRFEPGESPEDCVKREFYEETGLTLIDPKLRGVVTFAFAEDPTEYMFLYSADRFTGEMIKEEDSPEGILRWVGKEEVLSLPIWPGDRILLRLLKENAPFFSLKLCYRKDGSIYDAELDGKKIKEALG